MKKVNTAAVKNLTFDAIAAEEMKNQKEIVKLIERRMKEKGVNHYRMTMALEINNGNWTHMVNGKKYFTIPILQKVCQFLDLEIEL